MSDGMWGFLGVITGVAATSASRVVEWWFKDGRAARKRKAALRKMLNTDFNDGWRKIETLSRVIGANVETTRNLLLEISARASEKGSQEKWALIAKHPIPTHNDDE